MDDYRSWADLPVDILGLIRDCLWFSDLACFAAVCKPWRSVKAESPHLQSLKFPWLAISISKDPSTLSWVLFSPVECRFHHLDHLRVPRGARCIGVSHGWLIFNKGTSRVLGNYLLNPLTNQKIDLPLAFHVSRDGTPFNTQLIYSPPPPFSTNFYKAVLSSPLTSNNIATGKCMVVAQHSSTGKLFFCRPGDEIWSNFPSLDLTGLRGISNFIVIDGHLYCINALDEVVVFKLALQSTLIKIYRPAKTDDYHILHLPYLLESNGELWMVRRRSKQTDRSNRNDDAYEQDLYLWNNRLQFEVFKLDTHRSTWIQMKSLGDQVLFLDKNRCRSITLATDSYFRRNCIYFTYYPVSNCNKPHTLNWYVFCMEDESIQRFYLNYSQPKGCEPLWFMLDE